MDVMAGQHLTRQKTLSILAASLVCLLVPNLHRAVAQTPHRIQISSDADDGYYNSNNGTGWHSAPENGNADWVGSSSGVATAWVIGYRFASTGINSGDTIQSAYLYLVSSDGNASNATCGSAPCSITTSTFRVYGVLQNDGPFFSGVPGNTPLDVPYTNAYTDYTNTGPGDVHGSCLGNNSGQNTCTHVIDVTNIVREITSQPGWSNTSAIRFVLTSTSPSLNVFAGFEDSSANAAKAATLVVNPPLPTIVSTGAWGTDSNTSYPTSYFTGPFVYPGASTLLLFLGDYYAFPFLPPNSVPVSQPSVTDNCGNNWQILAGPADWLGVIYQMRSTVYYVQNPVPCSAGATIHVTMDNQEPIYLHFMAVAGSDTSQAPVASAFTNPSPGTYTSTATTDPVTLTSSGLLVSWIFGDSDAPHTFTPQSGFTADLNSTPNYLTTVHENVSSGTYTNTFSISPTDGWQTVLIGLFPSGGGGSGGGSSAPSIVSASTASGLQGQAFSYQIQATNSPTSYGASGLPNGLSVNTSTGLISGSPTQSGTFSVGLSAGNGIGTGTATLTLTVTSQTTPTITWATPSAIGYGTALSSTQLDATTSVPGTFAYSPSSGTVPNAGTQTLSVTFTPTDTTTYTTATQSVLLVVNQASPTITWATPSAIGYATALSSTQLDATASVPGTFAYTPAAGTVLSAGTQTLSVTFTPTDTTNYTTATQSVQLVINQASPAITWATPSAIGYGTALSSTQLDATASVPGTFAYTPPAGTVLNSGTQTLSATFTPTDTTNYTMATQAVQLMVNKAGAPTITWPTPAAITYGAALSATQLDASTSVAGTFAYSPAAGVVLNAGTQALSATFTPTDTVDYPTASQSVQLVVNKAAQAIIFTLPGTVGYGTSPLALTATGGSSGNAVTFSVLSGPATISGNSLVLTGTGVVSVAANQAGNANYLAAPQVTDSLTVTESVLAVTANNASRVYGTPNPPFTGTVTGALNGDTFTESFSTAATTTSDAGTYPILPSVAGTNLAAYSVAIQNGTLTVTKAGTTTTLVSSSGSIAPGQTLTLTASVASSTSGAPTGTVIFFDGTVQLGSATLSSGSATFATSTLAGGTTHSLTAAYGGDTNFTASSTTASTPIVVSVGGDFTLTVLGTSSQSVLQGGAVSYQLVANPLSGGYPGAISFSAAGLPVGATMSFNPASIAANAGQQTVTATIQTVAVTTADLSPSLGRRLAPISLAVLLLPLLGAGRIRRRTLDRFLVVVLLLGATAAALSGCSADYRFTRQPQSYNVEVTASGAGVQHSVTLALNVQ